jgi:hypothetical protein
LKLEKRQGSDGKKSNQSKKICLHHASIKAMISAIKADAETKDLAGELESESESENEEAKGDRNSNCTNKALQKKKKK